MVFMNIYYKMFITYKRNNIVFIFAISLFQLRYAGFRVLALVNRYAEDIIDLMYQGVDFAHAQYQAGYQIATAIAQKVWVKIQDKWAVSIEFTHLKIIVTIMMCVSVNCQIDVLLQ